MNKRALPAIALIVGSIVSAGAFSAQKPAAPKSVLQAPKLTEKDLPLKYQNLLTLVTYIITAKEKDVFLMLTNDRDRDIFIESFWKLRDPTPGTPANEYKVEHLKRFEYANQIYARGAGKRGWMTDRGRFYIILGPPISIERFDSVLGLRPCEIWSYYSDGRKNLPLHFLLVFFQKGGAGEYKLYDPFVDGPKALMTMTASAVNIDVEDYEAQRDWLIEIAPTLADAAISLIPGEYGFGYQPMPRNTILIVNILDSPKADIRPTYATHFLEYKGLVSTEYMSNFVDSEALITVLQDPALKARFVHFSIKPASASADYYEAKDQYYCAFAVSVSLRPAGQTSGEPVFQYTKDFPFYFPPADEAKVRSNGVAIEDTFPIVEGKYRLSILLQNAVRKEFSLFENDLEILSSGQGPRLAGPFLGFRSQAAAPNLYVPFKIGAQKLLTDPANAFGRGDAIVYAMNVENVTQDLWKEGAVRISIRGASGKPESRKSLELKLRQFPFTRDIPITETLQAKDFAPEYYEFEATLVDGKGNPLFFGKTQFIVSPTERLGHPIPMARALSADNRYVFFGMLAQQSSRINDNAKADAYYQQAFAMKPDFTKGLAEYAAFLLKVGELDKCLDVVERFKSDGGLRFEYLATRGKALLGKGRTDEAVAALLDANRIYNSDTGVLNALGLGFFKQQKKKEALETLRASLKLNADQADVKKLIAEIETALK
ncbi:MAG: GWxTD domain-containing protein [Candidatus Aminicenantes bacterium]|nr:GWxTD domain-containing protein [Candidatus Aminicenantes bacterium]